MDSVGALEWHFMHYISLLNTFNFSESCSPNESHLIAHE